MAYRILIPEEVQRMYDETPRLSEVEFHALSRVEQRVLIDHIRGNTRLLEEGMLQMVYESVDRG